jgi:hypothetical protein
MAYAASEDDTDLDGTFLKLKGWVKLDRQANAVWYTEAERDFGMYAGGEAQWESADIDRLKENNKPYTAFNFIQPSVSAVNGMEVSNRQEVTFLPRTTQTQSAAPPMPNAMPAPQAGPVPPGPPAPGADDQGPAEVLTAGGKYFRDQCDAEDEESDAFQDDAICGMGWTETRVDYEDQPDGMMRIDRRDPLEMGWDCQSTKRNLVDARRLHRVCQMDKRAAEDMFPGYDCADIDAAWAKPTLTNEPVDREEAREYINEQGRENDSKTITVCEVTWFDTLTSSEVANLDTGEVLKDQDSDQVKTLRERAKKMGIRIAVKKVTKKVYKYAFLGRSEVLGDDPDGTLCQSQKGFKFQCMTGTRDRNKRQWMGIVRAMRDPQRWANSLYSSSLHNIMTSGKGIMAERTAFEKPEQAEADWAKSDMITWLRPGALTGAQPAIMQKTPHHFPPELVKMMEFALSAMRGVSGVNLETLGGADREQAASLEYQRRQAATTILAPFFDGLRRYRKEQGRIMLDLIRLYMSDGRLVRIVGPNYEQYVPLVKDEGVTEFDIIVSESPSSPNQKEATWMILQQMLPVIGGANGMSPKAMGVLLKASPLPLDTVKEFQDVVEQEQAEAANQPPPPEVQKIMAETEKIKIEGAAKAQEMEIRAMEAQLGFETTQLTLADAGEQRKHDMQMRGFDMRQAQEKHQMDMAARQAETQGASDVEFAKASGSDMPAKFDALGQGLQALAAAIGQGMTALAQSNAATQQTMAELAKLVAAPRQTVLQTDASGMPIGASSSMASMQ